MKIKLAKITFRDLIEEALTIPASWKEEVFVEDGEVEIGSLITMSSWTGKANSPNELLDTHKGDIESMSISEFEGFYERKDGMVEIADNGDEKGEYYDKCSIVAREEAINSIEEILSDEDIDLYKLYQKLKEEE